MKYLLVVGLLILVVAISGCTAPTGQVTGGTQKPLIQMPDSSEAAEVTAIEVSGGSSILIESSGKVALLDCGPDNTTLDFLKEQIITKIDLMVVTNPANPGRIGGCAAILEEIEVEQIADNGLEADSQAYTEYAALAEGKRDTLALGSLLPFASDVGMGVFWPNSTEPLPFEGAGSSLVLKLVDSTRANFLFMSDCSGECEKAVMGSGVQLWATILYPGPESSTELIEAVNPTVVAYSGTPPQGLIDVVGNRVFYRTDLNESFTLSGFN